MIDSSKGKLTELTRDPRPKEIGNGMAAMMITLLTIFATLAVLAIWPEVKQYIPDLAGPARVKLLGPVPRIRYVGGFGFSTHTLVELGAVVALLAGAVELERGVTVGRRQRAVVNRLCVVDTERCPAIGSR